jgi:hypothetical protein
MYFYPTSSPEQSVQLALLPDNNSNNDSLDSNIDNIIDSIEESGY